MAEATGNERGHDGGDLASAARDRGMEQLESAKAQLAEGAERVAAAVERTADELDDGSGEGMSGFGHSAATLMRRLAGGLRERDVEEFASELGSLARRNPGAFLAGSVALGFGIARFFKARPSRGQTDGRYASRGNDYASRGDEYAPRGDEWRSSGEQEWRSSFDSGSGSREDYDPDESLDLSGSSLDRRDTEEGRESAAVGSSPAGSVGPDVGLSPAGTSSADSSGRREEERVRGKSRQASRQRGKAQRAAGSQQSTSQQSTSTEPSAAAPADSAEPGGTTGNGALRGDQS